MFTTDIDTSQLATPKRFITNTNSNSIVLDTATLVQMVQLKSEKGFNILYDNYCGVLYGILIKFVEKNDVADDLLQEVFLKIWKNIDSFDSERGTLFTWMLNIARNHAIDYIRSSYHRNQLLHVRIDSFDSKQNYNNLNDSNNTSVEFKDVKNRFLKLDSKYADVINLIFFYGCTYEQAASIMNLPLGTVKTRARKGIGMLKILYRH